MQVERRADADRDAVDAGDNRLLRRGERGEEIPDFQSALAAGGNRHEVVEIVACGECSWNAEKDMHADGRIGIAHGECGGHHLIHGAGERVLLVRPVHADHLDRAAALDDDVLRHVCPYAEIRLLPAASKPSPPLHTWSRNEPVSPARFSAKKRQSAMRLADPSASAARAR